MPQPLDPNVELADAVADGRLALAEIAAIPPPELDALFELAAQCLDTGRHEEAESLLGGVVTLFPFSAKYWRAYGVALHRNQRFERAAAAYQAALALQPDHEWARCYRAEVLLYLGLTAAAGSELERLAASADPQVAARAQALLAEADRWVTWVRGASPHATSPVNGDEQLDAPRFVLRDQRPLPLVADTATEATERIALTQESTLTARLFWLATDPGTTDLLPREATSPTHTDTALLPRALASRTQPQVMPPVFDTGAFEPVTRPLAALPQPETGVAIEPSTRAEHEVTKTAVLWRRERVPLIGPSTGSVTASPASSPNRHADPHRRY